MISRAARARAAAIIGSEMSTPVQRPLGPRRRATATVVLPVPQPTSSTWPACAMQTASTSRSSNGLYNWSSKRLRFDPRVSGGAVPTRRLRVTGGMRHVHGHLLTCVLAVKATVCHLKST